MSSLIKTAKYIESKYFKQASLDGSDDSFSEEDDEILNNFKFNQAMIEKIKRNPNLTFEQKERAIAKLKREPRPARDEHSEFMGLMRSDPELDYDEDEHLDLFERKLKRMKSKDDRFRLD